MENLISILFLYPFAGFLISLLLPAQNERLISRFVFFIMASSGIMVLLYTIGWALNDFSIIENNFLTLYQSDKHIFLLHFIYTKATAVYMVVGTFLVYLVTIYCRYYLHKENGFKRFFSAILFFYSGFSLITISGNLFTLFIGWEFLGISSFFLIAFYRNRYLPVKNAVKVFSIYRLGDIGILLALWMNHHLWERNITFNDFLNQERVLHIIHKHPLESIFVSLMLLLAASAKSAQFPFSSWLPRAMEGPTPSSAIFYGSLSVNLGVLLLLKTYMFWDNILLIKFLIIGMGLFTSILASFMARVQSSIKSQIAYASIVQIGLIFIEIALGMENLALFHFAGNAFLRTYQLLVSPSVVSYLIKEQFFNFISRQKPVNGILSYKLENTLYILSVKEFNLGEVLSRIYWSPLKYTGKLFEFLKPNHLLVSFILLGILSIVLLHFMPFENIDSYWVAVFYASMALIFILRSFVERNKARLGWTFLVAGNFFLSLSTAFNCYFKLEHFIVFNSGIITGGLIGYIVLQNLREKEHRLYLGRFNGHVYEHPVMAMIFFLCTLALFGFPISPTFIGVDINFSEIQISQWLLLFLFSLAYVVTGLSAIRLYTRIFLGPHIKTYHETAFRSS